MTRLDRAIEDLKKEYESAKKQIYARNALAYALYQTWKKYDAIAYDRWEKQDVKANSQT